MHRNLDIRSPRHNLPHGGRLMWAMFTSPTLIACSLGDPTRNLQSGRPTLYQTELPKPAVRALFANSETFLSGKEFPNIRDDAKPYLALWRLKQFTRDGPRKNVHAPRATDRIRKSIGFRFAHASNREASHSLQYTLKACESSSRT